MPDALQRLPVQAADGHRWDLLSIVPPAPRALLLWLPALGVAARHYTAFAEALAKQGIAVFVHEWRGHGSSSLRAGHHCDWGYRELLTLDLAASREAITVLMPAALPAALGGRSLGGQLAACRVALAPGDASRLWLVASGSPYSRAFPPLQRRLFPLAYRALPWLADRCGALPGRKIGFGGREARGVMHDWSRSALRGRYAAAGLDIDLEVALAGVRAAVTGVVFDRDWLAPTSSLKALLDKMPAAPARIARVGDRALGTRSDHFRWMKHPSAVARLLAGSMP